MVSRERGQRNEDEKTAARRWFGKERRWRKTAWFIRRLDPPEQRGKKREGERKEKSNGKRESENKERQGIKPRKGTETRTRTEIEWFVFDFLPWERRFVT